jgi:hypothetical protein
MPCRKKKVHSEARLEQSHISRRGRAGHCRGGRLGFGCRERHLVAKGIVAGQQEFR